MLLGLQTVGVKLTENTFLEEEPQDGGISQKADGVSKHELCADPPPEEAKV